jgi:hypothetical protein
VGGLLVLAATRLVCAADGDAFTDAAKAGPDFAVQGEYKGDLQIDGKATPTGVQVIAEGDGNFEAVVYTGGLPGAGWKRGDKREKAKGKTEGGTTNFKSDTWLASIADGKMNFINSGGDKLGSLDKTERKSPTIGAKPPAGAVVLFDGTNTDQLPGAKMTEDHLLMAGAMSKQEFQDFTLHIEFRLPFMPKARGQGRANSGVYLQNRYELQVLDSFGLEGENNECGGFYTLVVPSVNMCLPPLVWQTYDIDFTGARFNDQKEKTQNAKVTVKHNGVTIHDNYELPKLCPGGASQEYPGKGPFQLQYHGNPVVYQNFWVLEKK